MKNTKLKTVISVLVVALIFALILPLFTFSRKSEFTATSSAIELIKDSEGFTGLAKKDENGVWKLGYGMTEDWYDVTKIHVMVDIRVSQPEAERFLEEYIREKTVAAVNNLVNSNVIMFSLTQNEFDALVAFTFDRGEENLRKLVTGKEKQTVIENILSFNKGPDGKVDPELVIKREKELELFLQK